MNYRVFDKLVALEKKYGFFEIIIGEPFTVLVRSKGSNFLLRITNTSVFEQDLNYQFSDDEDDDGEKLSDPHLVEMPMALMLQTMEAICRFVGECEINVSSAEDIKQVFEEWKLVLDYFEAPCMCSKRFSFGGRKISAEADPKHPTKINIAIDKEDFQIDLFNTYDLNSFYDKMWAYLNI